MAASTSLITKGFWIYVRSRSSGSSTSNGRHAPMESIQKKIEGFFFWMLFYRRYRKMWRPQKMNFFVNSREHPSWKNNMKKRKKKKRKRKYIYAKVFGSLTCIATAVVWNDSESQKKKKQTKNHFLRHERHRLICIWPHTGRKRLPNRHSTKFPTVAVYSLNLNSIGPRALTTYIYANQSFPKCVSIGLRTCKTPNDVMTIFITAYVL